MRCQHLRRKWSTLRLLYVRVLGIHSGWISTRGLITLTGGFCRSRMRSARNYLHDKVPVPSKHRLLKSPSTNCLLSCRLLLATRNTSGPARIAILARFAAPRGGSSTSVWLKAWWWCPWLVCRCLLFGSSSRVHGKVRIPFPMGAWNPASYLIIVFPVPWFKSMSG